MWKDMGELSIIGEASTQFLGGPRRFLLVPTLLQGLLKMKPSSGKVQAWEWKTPVLVPEHFAPCPYWYFTFFHAGNIFRYLEQDLTRDVSGKFRKSLKL